MKRRSFFAGMAATVGGLFLPYEPEVIYSFPTPRRLSPLDKASAELERGMSTLVIYSGTPLDEGRILATIPLSGKDWVVEKGVARLVSPVTTVVETFGRAEGLALLTETGEEICRGPLEMGPSIVKPGDDVQIRDIKIS